MLDKQIVDFNESIIGLREFIDLIDPILTDKLKEHDEHISPLISLGVIKQMLTQNTELEEGEKEKIEGIQSKINAKILEIYKEEIDVEIETEEDKADSSMRLKIPSNIRFQEHLANAGKTKNHIELLYRNSLISLLSSVEWFFSQILHFYYDKHPDASGIQKKTMTLSDLKGFGTIEDAEKYLIDIKIEEILRGNFDSWISLLKSELSLNMGYIEPIKNELIEIYQRRNLLVHNGGVVNSIYISKVEEKFRKDIKQNDKLNVDKEYLDNAICKLQKAFILIAAELWKNLDKTDKKRGDVLGEITYENILKSKWDICEGLTYFMINDAQLETTDKVIAQLNYWLCKKRTNQMDSIRNELNKADFSDKKEIFQLGLFAIKDDVKSFIEILPHALNSNQINIERLEEFPIFEEIRKTEDYIKFKEESKYFKEPNQEVIPQ
ncbi:hypothetical protein [Pedobacter sp.]|uniref:hypothetical protein n=1 Tax=Pedobacter sp. TaxID=1411316 RepID=UPI0031E2E65E